MSAAVSLCSCREVTQPPWPAVSKWEVRLALFFREFLMKRTRNTERSWALLEREENTASGFDFLKSVPGTHLQIKLLKSPLLWTVPSKDYSVQEKNTLCPRRRVIAEKIHCSILLFLVSIMFPPTQEGAVWDVSCCYGDNWPRSLVWRSPWPHSTGSLEQLYEVGIWSTSAEPMAVPICHMEEGHRESTVLLLSCTIRFLLLVPSMPPAT